MQSSLLSLATLASLASFALADSESFGLITIRSGSQFQYQSVSDSGKDFTIGGSGDSIGGVITDDGLFKLGDGSYVVVNEDGTLSKGSKGSSPFSISDGYLAYQGSSGFSVDPSSYTLYFGSKGTGIGLRATLSSGSEAADFTPSGSSNDSSSNDTTTSTTASISSYEASGNKIQAAAGLAAIAALLI